MKKNKIELVEFSNSRDEFGPKFSSYENYVEYQTLNGLSFESYSEGYSNGQKIYLSSNFETVDRNMRIADISCGDGVGLKFFKENFFNNVVGFEISDDKINFAKKYGYRIIKHDVCSDIFDIEFTEYFDIIYSSHTLEHVLDPIYSINLISKILKQNGLLYIVLPYPNITDKSDPHSFMVHCGSIPLSLDVLDDATTTENKIMSLGFELVSKKFDNFREPEVWFIFRKK